MKNPVCAFDVETTGLDPAKDRVLQLSCIRIDNNGKRTANVWYIKPEGNYEISEVAAEKTGLTKEIIEKKGVAFADVADDFIRFIDGCDLLVYNGSFDIHFLQCEFDRIGKDPCFCDHTIIDSFLIETTQNSHKLEDVYARMTGQPLENAHDAYFDVCATIDVYAAQFRTYGKDRVSEIVAENNRGRSTDGCFRVNDDGEWCFTFGKYKDSTLRSILAKDLGYVRWMCDTNKVCLPTRKIIKAEMQKMINENAI